MHNLRVEENIKHETVYQAWNSGVSKNLIDEYPTNDCRL